MKKAQFTIIALVMIIIIGALYYYVSLGSPIIFGDEGFHGYTIKWMSENGQIPDSKVLSETDISHKPHISQPLYHLVGVFFWSILGEFGLKLMIPLFTIISALLMYTFFYKKNKPEIGLLSSFILMMTPILITYGVLNYTDAFLVMLFTAFLYFLGDYAEKQDKNSLVLVGIITGLSILTKGTGVIAFLFLIFYFITNKERKWKDLLFVIMIILLISSPWIIRNIIVFGDICYDPLLGSGCAPYNDVAIEPTHLEFAGRTSETGTEASAFKIGLHTFANFAFGWIISILFVFGLVNYYFKKDKLKSLVVLWLIATIVVFLGASIGLFKSSPRAEDAARWIIFAAPIVAMISGIFINDLYKFAKKKSKFISYLLILIIIASVFTVGVNKIFSMGYVKNFSPGIFDGCDWIKENTPEDVLLYSPYPRHVAYTCMRRTSIADKTSHAIIELSGNDDTYNVFKMHGYDYIFVLNGLISSVPYEESHSTTFIKYIQTSNKYEVVYDNTEKYGGGGVTIFKIT